MFQISESLANVIGGVLVAVHVGLGLWAIVGLIEFFAPSVPWTRISNELFPPSVMLAQWAAVLVCAVVFVVGYLTRWPLLPKTMVAIYGVMAAICAVETVGFLVHDGRFAAMAAEYVTYAAILVFLFFSSAMRARFGV